MPHISDLNREGWEVVLVKQKRQAETEDKNTGGESQLKETVYRLSKP